MKIVLNNLLVFLLFLSPIVSGFEPMQCHGSHDSATTKVNCHESSEHSGIDTIQPMSDFSNTLQMSDMNCCSNGQCHCFSHNVANVVYVAQPKILIIHESMILFDQKYVPVQQLQPPFRPPIS